MISTFSDSKLKCGCLSEASAKPSTTECSAQTMIPTRSQCAHEASNDNAAGVRGGAHWVHVVLVENTLQLNTVKPPKTAREFPRPERWVLGVSHAILPVNHLKCETCSRGLLEVC